ncbi:hypothetical protein GCM10009122_12450 [Fulvivirga kasyanovii]|uniref:Uncharacterized protein n=1 Tax=Fulvivirga kasyanovii TaxID=396812 RepID=A0ABW9RKR3_9BACT|nr:hypothetical protein [Fulvivirga kasyanovii]MTI23959.1 hypothetical protein [Fulvivirga kasyanovii]
MIPSHKFIALELKDQLKTLFLEGSFIVSIRYYGYKINLYLLNNFYVEVFYNHKHDHIEKVQPLDKNHTRMKFYSDQIKLPGDLMC